MREEQEEVRTFQFVSVTCAHIPTETPGGGWVTWWKRFKRKRNESFPSLSPASSHQMETNILMPAGRQLIRCNLNTRRKLIRNNNVQAYIKNKQRRSWTVFFAEPMLNINQWLMTFLSTLQTIWLAHEGLWDTEEHKTNICCVGQIQTTESCICWCNLSRRGYLCQPQIGMQLKMSLLVATWQPI